MTPWDWQQLVRLCGSKKQLNVVSMETEDFKNFGYMYEVSGDIIIMDNCAVVEESTYEISELICIIKQIPTIRTNSGTRNVAKVTSITQT
nr:unnamed protein product [Callosobruchus analis]